MKHYRLIIQPPALADVDEAYQWIHRQAPDAAARWFNRLIETLDTLKTLPERCGLAPENDALEPEIRQLLYGRRGGVYRVLFTVAGDEVHVLHIRHAARRTMTAEEFAEGET